MKPKTRHQIPAAAAAALLLAVSPAAADWVHFSDSIFDAQGEVFKHPRQLSRVIVLPTPAEADLVEVCIGYLNNVEKRDRGKVTAKVTMTDPDDNVEVVNLGGGVNNGAYGECRGVPPMPANTIVEFDFRFKKFAQLRDDDRLQVAAAVAIDGANPFARQPGPLSIEDQEAVAKLAEWVTPGRGVALRREANGWAIDWRVGSEVFVIEGFATIAAAVAAWCTLI